MIDDTALRKKAGNPIDYSLRCLAEASITCIGGEFHKVSGALVGGPALNAFANLQFDFALIGATGLNFECIWNMELTKTQIKGAHHPRQAPSQPMLAPKAW
jgi:DeoR/GlpR family transcriptional regulator of sugar metabolism